MERLFGKLKMSWLAVILFAIVAGVYTGTVMLIPALEGTSFQDIGIAYEWWIIFAVIIVVNCKKSWEAMLKCFTFFFISQPVVYAVEVLFGSLPLDKALYYYLGIWLPMIILTLPGGFIAYFCKKQNVFGTIILGLGNTMLTVLGIYYLVETIRRFPYHLLSAVVCFAAIVILSLCIQKKKANRWIAILLPLVLAGLALVLMKLTGRVLVPGLF